MAHHLTDTAFSTLNLPEALMQGVRQAGFELCTPIQAQTLPIALAGHDVAGQAQTGTGKTAAFLLATFNHLLQREVPASGAPAAARSPRALILAPTRELAVQIHHDAAVLAQGTHFSLGLVYGGTGYDSQRKMLEQGVDVLIATPGRIIDYFKQHIFDLKSIQVVVLDEADRMFDLGFIKDIRFLLRRMPPPTERLNMLFSATLSYRVMELAYEHMNNPQFVRIEPDRRTADTVEQRLYHTAVDEKIPLLVGLLRHMDPTRTLVFTNTKDMAERLAAWLQGNGFRASVLSGDVPQTIRLRLLKEFTEGQLPILVATDVAARGLHIPDVSHVFNFDLPQNAEDYVHRIGRTARLGASGDAISFACERYVLSLVEIEAFLGHKLPTARATPELLPALAPPAARAYAADAPSRRPRPDRHGPKPGRRPSARPARTHVAAAKTTVAPSTAPAPNPAPPKPNRVRARRPNAQKPVVG